MSFPPSFCAPQHLEVLLNSLLCFSLLPCPLPLPQFLLFHKHIAYGPWGTLRLCYILPYKQAVHPPQHTHIFLPLRSPLMYIFTPGNRNDVWDPSFHGQHSRDFVGTTILFCEQQSYCSQPTVYRRFGLDFFFSGLELFRQRTKTGLSYCSDGCVGSKLEVLAKLKKMTWYQWACVYVYMCVYMDVFSLVLLLHSRVFYEGKGHFLQECVRSVSAAEI